MTIIHVISEEISKIYSLGFYSIKESVNLMVQLLRSQPFVSSALQFSSPLLGEKVYVNSSESDLFTIEKEFVERAANLEVYQ
jgi:hypothetical protein